MIITMNSSVWIEFLYQCVFCLCTTHFHAFFYLKLSILARWPAIRRTNDPWIPTIYVTACQWYMICKLPTTWCISFTSVIGNIVYFRPFSVIFPLLTKFFHFIFVFQNNLPCDATVASRPCSSSHSSVVITRLSAYYVICLWQDRLYKQALNICHGAM